MGSKEADDRFFAVIDIGSNSAKISIAKINGKSYSVILQEKESIRLLEANEKEISQGKVESLLRILRHFGDLAHGYECQLRCVATSAMRRAENQKAICQRVEKELGFPITVITGDQETDYIIEATKARFDLRKGAYWIVDIGGGSAEAALLIDQKTVQKVSLPIGAVVMKDRYFDGTRLKSKEVEIISEELAKLIQTKLHFEKCNSLIISGGSPSAVAKVIRTSGSVHGAIIHVDDVRKVISQLAKEGSIDLAEQYGISKSRVDLVLPAACIIRAFLEFTDEKKYIVSKTGLREGIICSEVFK